MSFWRPGAWALNGSAAWRMKHGLGLAQRGIEVGVRVEVHNDIMQDLCDIIYDPTFFIQTGKI